jgi:hypothetical protein
MPRICKAVIKGNLSFKMKQLITSFFLGSLEVMNGSLHIQTKIFISIAYT